MMYEIVKYPAAVLMRPARRIGPHDGHDLHQLFADMIETMNANHGVGLAAPQVGLGIRFIVAHNIEDGKDYGLANPQIVHFAGGIEVRSEGCLSFPELYGDVERSLSVTVRFQDLDWVQREETYSAHFARVLQHEIDHLNGVLLIDRAIGEMYTYEEDEEGEEAEEGGEPGTADEAGDADETDALQHERVASEPHEAL
jgi:peptide deformylase